MFYACVLWQRSVFNKWQKNPEIALSDSSNIEAGWSKVYIFLFLTFTGFLLFQEFCEQQCDEPVPQIRFYEAVSI